MGVFANLDGRSTVRNAFHLSAANVPWIGLAAPFFSYSAIVKEIGTAETRFSVLVRLGPSTSPDALRDIIGRSNVQIRFFTSNKFHSKLYIFGDRFAVVGSANLTGAGLQSNREVVVRLTREPPEFDDLVSLFQAYWDEASVLDRSRLDAYARLWSQRGNAKSPDAQLEELVRAEFGEILPGNGVQIGQSKPSSAQLYLEGYRRSYQEFLVAFRELEQVYASFSKRQQPTLPLRIEIDQFFSFVREEHCPGDSYLEAPFRAPEARRELVHKLISAWFLRRWEWLDDHVMRGYPHIQQQFASPEAIASATMPEVIDALEVCHAFRELLRFHLGGLPTVRSEFANQNDLARVKRSLTFLLHGKGSFVDRMGTVIFDPAYKLPMVGRSVVQEILGWVNSEDVPICNGRTTKSLRYLGYEVAV